MKSKIYRISEPNSTPQLSGNGEKGLIIVIDSKDKEENMATLEGLVKAIKYDIQQDVTIVTCHGEATSINELLASKKYTDVILIGITPNQLGFSMNAGQYFFYKMEGFSILLTDSLHMMNADKAKKMKFWQNLQSRFLN